MYDLIIKNGLVVSPSSTVKCDVAVNGRRVNIASYRVKVGDVVSVIENSKNLDIIKTAVEDSRVPAWLELDKAAFSGKVIQNPTKDDLDFDLNESLIVEFYSR